MLAAVSGHCTLRANWIVDVPWQTLATIRTGVGREALVAGHTRPFVAAGTRAQPVAVGIDAPCVPAAMNIHVALRTQDATV